MNDVPDTGVVDKVDTDIKQKVERPKMYNAILINDDYTPMDFVVKVLLEFFHKTGEDAVKIMMEVHTNGKGIAGTYTKEIASQKVSETMSAASHYGYPLVARVEKAP